jgi:hypothetical protein
VEHDTTVLAQEQPLRLGGSESPLRIIREWPRPRYLTLQDRPIYELFPLCETCPPLFRQLGDARGVVSVAEFKHRLDAGLNAIDEDLLSRLSSVLPLDEYLPVLLRLWPRLVIPGQPGDYFTNERWRAFEHDPADSDDVAAGPYYRGTTIRLGPEDSLFEFVMPLVSPSSNDAARVQHYKDQMTQGVIPTALAFSLLDGSRSDDIDDDDGEFHWGLGHFLLDGHNKIQAAAELEGPLDLMTALSLHSGKAAPEVASSVVEVLAGEQAMDLSATTWPVTDLSTPGRWDARSTGSGL